MIMTMTYDEIEMKHENIENEIFSIFNDNDIKNMSDYNASNVIMKNKLDSLIIELYVLDCDEEVLKEYTSFDEHIKNYIELNNVEY